MALLNKNAAVTEHKENATEDHSNLISSGNLAGSLCLVSKTISHNWIIDSGATDHICNTINMFTNVKEVDSNLHEVTIPDGSKLKVTKIGDVHFNDRVTLRNVLFLPSIRFNLISVHKLCSDNNISLTFSPFECWF